MIIVKKMFKEISVSSILVLFFDSFISAIMVFVALYFFFTFFRIGAIFAVIPVIFIFAISFLKKLRLNKVVEIEKQYPELNEMLRTSRDYQDKKNDVVIELHTQVLRKVNQVDISALLDSKKLLWKFIVISIILFLTTALASTGLHFFDVSQTISSSPLVERIRESGKRLIDDNFNFGLKTNYSEDPDIAQLNENEVNLTLDIYNTELDISDISEPEDNDFGGEYPESIGGIAQDIYSDNIPEEHKDTIKEYFEKIGE